MTNKATKHTYLHAAYLFARPSFVSGIARIIDPFGILNAYNMSDTEKMADALALYSDWKAVGDDLRAAMQEYAGEVSP